MPTTEEQVASFDDIDCVVSDSLRFRRKLAIGEDAYTSLRLGKTVSQLWDVGGVAVTGAQIAAAPAVASTFFGGGFLSVLGIGAAATPIGWVIAASVLTGGAYYGVTRLFRTYNGSRVEVIPKFINTPVDLLGASLLDLIGGLSVKIAVMDGTLSADESAAIRDHFIEEWGFNQAYVDRALQVITENSGKQTLTEMIESFAGFARSNPDCNFSVMRRELVAFLQEIAKADGHLDEREEMAIERIDRIMGEADKTRPKMPSLGGITAAPSQAAGWVGSVTKKLFKKTEDPSVSE